MQKFLISLFLLLWAGFASAETCPEFFRFVDFGQTGQDGVTYRGGSILRAEGFDGSILMKLESTECLAVRETATDGRRLKIPVVKSIYYEPKKTGIDLTELHIRSVDNTNVVAEKNAENHRDKLIQDGVDITQGSDSLCVTDEQATSLSCQVVSPYPGNTALVVYCDSEQCTMPVMAIDKQLVISASWPQLPDYTGDKIVKKINQISEFLIPLTSLNPG